MSSRLRRIATTRPEFRSGLHDERLAAVLGASLGVTFTVCFVTGVLSHVSQNPPGWYSWPARPAGMYRFTQGLHVTMGIASIPLLLAKLWVVYPNLFVRPPVRSVAHAVERLALLPLVGGGILLLFTGLANINLWRPWTFSFRSGHYAAAWIAIGGMVVHVGAKWTVIRASGSGADDEASDSARDGGLDRRGFMTTVFGSAGLLVLFTVGQAFEPLRKLALLTPRRPDVGPQGFPVNRTAGSVGLVEVDLDTWRLRVDGPGVTSPLELSYADLEALPQRTETLPIACVEGWSTSQQWTGVPLRDLLDLAGADRRAEAVVYAMHDNPRQRTSPVNSDQARDRGTLLALKVNDEVLAPDHGFPLRLIGPNRPGVHQTKWVTRGGDRVNRTREGREHGAVFWTCFAVGGSIMAWGGRLFLDATPDLARRANFTAFLVGAALVHDLVFVPLLALVGVVVVRVAPRGARAAIQAGLMASGVILLVAAAPLRDTAARAGNPTIQPLDYGTATLTALAVVWVAVALAALAIRLRPDRPT